MQDLIENTGSTSGSGNWPSDGLESLAQCPVCGGREKTLLYSGLTDRIYHCAPGEWDLFRCSHCDSAYLDPRPNCETIGIAYRKYFTQEVAVPDYQRNVDSTGGNFRQALRNDYLNARYSSSLFPTHRLGRILLPLIPPLRERADRWIRHLPSPRPGARLLEIGCGNGGFLLAMRDMGWDVQGLEPDVKAAQVARSHGLSVVDGVLTPGLFAEASFDAISLHHVVEHLHNPFEALELCLNLLRPSGTISVIAPNLASRGSRNFGRNWYHLDPPRYLVVSTTRSLVDALKRCGFGKVTAHASFFIAASVFRDSAKLEAESGGSACYGSQHVKGRFVRLSNLLASLSPSASEEAVVTATRPA